VVDGVDLDAVVAAVRGCPGVDDLIAGPWGGVVSYLPGRQIPGVRVAADHLVISVRSRWDVPAASLARHVRAALAALAGPRRIDVVVADIADAGTACGPGLAGPDRETSSWTTGSSGMPGAPLSAPIIPTSAATPPPSSAV
jgi:hypothetical protein